MNELLSNEEIETLLDMFRAEGEPTESVGFPGVGAPDHDEGVIRSVDLLKPTRVSSDHLRGLVRSFEGAAKMIAGTLSEKLRLDLTCDCVAVEQMRFQTWLSQMVDSAAIYVLKMEPFEPPVLFSVSTELLYSAVDRILGGSGKMAVVPKEFTAAEYTVADAFVGPCLDNLCMSLSDVVEASWQVEDRFCNTSMAQVLSPQDVVVTAYFQVGGESLLGDLRLAIPFAALEPFLESLSKGKGSGKGAGLRRAPGEMRETVARHLKSVPVELSVCLGKAHIRLRELLNLREDDVVPLRTRVGEPFVAPIQGVPKFKGKVGVKGKRFAFQVMELMES